MIFLPYLYNTILPWQGQKKDKKNVHTIIKKIKKDFVNSIDELNLCDILVYFFKYSIKLQYSEKPDYSHLIKYFYNYLKDNNMKYDGKWSWKSML